MKILCIGDVVGESGTKALKNNLSGIKRSERIDFTIVNGENSDVGNGISPFSANEIFSSGADVITTGNHVFKKRNVFDYLDENEYIVRPVNYPSSNPGRGYLICECMGKRILVINALGQAFMDFIPASPIDTIEKTLEICKDKYDISILDLHAESTSEKISIAHYFDGRIDLIFGTHTHIQTSDERILSGGSAYITDIGMCGVFESALGIDFAPVIERMRTGILQKYTEASGRVLISGIVYEYDEKTEKSVSIKRINVFE